MKTIAMILAAVIPSVQFAATWYVDGTNGSDDNPDTSQDTAKATIQAAIDVSKDNDTICVAPGIYAPIKATNSIISICSTHGASKTIIDGGGITNCAILGTVTIGDPTVPHTTLHGFTIKSGIAGCDPAEGSAAVDHGEIVDCIITECQSEDNILGACRASNCLIYNNKSGWSILRHGYAQNCTIVSNSSYCCAWDNSLKNCIARNSGTVYISHGNTESYSYNNVLDSETRAAFARMTAREKKIFAITASAPTKGTQSSPFCGDKMPPLRRCISAEKQSFEGRASARG